MYYIILKGRKRLVIRSKKFLTVLKTVGANTLLHAAAYRHEIHETKFISQMMPE